MIQEILDKYYPEHIRHDYANHTKKDINAEARETLRKALEEYERMRGKSMIAIGNALADFRMKKITEEKLEQIYLQNCE